MDDILKRLEERDIAAWDDAYSCRARGAEAAARIRTLEAERDEAMAEAISLAKNLHATHYSDVTQWEPLNYPAGVISQIDNMIAGIIENAKAALDALLKAERVKALREAAHVAYVACAETRHVTLGDKASEAILALIEKETGQ